MENRSPVSLFKTLCDFLLLKSSEDNAQILRMAPKPGREWPRSPSPGPPLGPWTPRSVGPRPPLTQSSALGLVGEYLLTLVVQCLFL